MSDIENRPEEGNEPRQPLPPPTFEFLVSSLRFQAEMHLGLMHFGPENERPKPELEMARHSIDMLAMIETKTKGNLDLQERRLIENSLTELRFRYIQAYEDSRKAAAATAESQQA